MITKTQEDSILPKMLIHLEEEELFFSLALWTGNISTRLTGGFLVILCSAQTNSDAPKLVIGVFLKALILLAGAKNPQIVAERYYRQGLFWTPQNTTLTFRLNFPFFPSTLAAPK